MRSRIRNLSALGIFLILAPSLAAADANPSSCDALFNLPGSTISLNSKDKTVMSPEVCAAYQDLIDRYRNPGPCSQKGLQNPQVDGIIRLNPQFALHLDQMLKAMPIQLQINSAFRTGGTDGGQMCANQKAPNSNHTKGCAVDLGYYQSSCDSSACQWVLAHAGEYGLRLRMHYSPEWNHIEPTDIASCQAGSQGNYSPTYNPPYVTNGNDLGPGGTMPAQANPFTTPPPPAFAPMTPIQPTQQPASVATPVQPIPYQQPTSALSNVLLNGNNLNVNTNTNGGTSTANNLLNLLQGSTSTQNPNYPAVSLNVSLSQGAQLQPTPTPNYSAPGVSSVQPYYQPQQTFTSSDLSGNPTNVPTPTTQTSFANPVQQILSTAKSILLNILSFLQHG